jgi:hypothetical protein
LSHQSSWNGCDRFVCTLGAQRQAFRERNDFWNDVQEVPAKWPFQVERFAQGDPTFGVSLGADSIPFRSTYCPIGEPRNGSITDLNLKRRRHPEGVIPYAVPQQLSVHSLSSGFAIQLTAGGCRGKIEAGPLLDTQISVTSR